MFTIIMIAVMAMFTIVLFLPRLVQKNAIVINTGDGLVRECDAPFLMPRLDWLIFFQPQIKYVGKMIISKNLMKNMMRRFMQFRNNLNKVAYKSYLLENSIKKRDGPFIGERFGLMEADAI